MSISAHRPPQTLPFTAEMRNACAQLMRTQVCVQHHVVKTQHTPDTTHTFIDTMGGFR